MKKLFLLVFAVLCAGMFTFAQNEQSISLKSSSNDFKVTEQSGNGFTFVSSIESLKTKLIQTPKGEFVQITVDGYNKTYNAGLPDFPTMVKLFEIPQDATVELSILSQSEEIITLSDYGISAKLYPAQASVSKSTDMVDVKFVYNEDEYLKNEFTKQQLAVVEIAGQMRASRFANLYINPFQYNPVTNTLKIINNVTVEVRFVGGNITKTNALKDKYFTPFFETSYKTFLNYDAMRSKNFVTDAPAKLVIVADPMFQSTLQPFIQWKRKRGFIVHEAYKGQNGVGTTTTSIKAYLQNLYTNPPAGEPAPTFVLLVGDMEQIPTFNGTAGSHVSDLYYCEYTNDKIPEVFYGRMSATNAAQLQSQIDKTLYYEQYQIADPSYLNEVVMVAGDDASHEMTWGNGQINYGTSNYFNPAHGITSHTYLQPLDNNAASIQIQANISAGVGYANYTAHCSPDGWAEPNFSVSDIGALQNANQYGLWVGNCCQSSQFNNDVCFAEAALRAVNKGAIGYIGGTNSSYWDEDYWWGCGFKTVTANPTYDATKLGAYDRMFHDHGEATSEWYVTQSQMVVGGNLAVQMSTSDKKAYYWEIYCLMGDPSLMIYMSQPDAVTANYLNTLMIGANSLSVTTEPYAYIALSFQNQLISTVIAGADGNANLTFTSLANVGMADIVITKQNRAPHIAQIQVIPAVGPYVTLDNFSINDAAGNNNGNFDYNEQILVNVTAHNVGVETALGVTSTLSTLSTDVQLINSNYTYGDITAGQTLTANGAFEIKANDNVVDQTPVSFGVAFTNGTDTWNSQFNLMINAPEFTIQGFVINDVATGNNDGILDPGETANVVVTVKNTGHASIDNIVGTVSASSTDLVLNTTTFNLASLAPNAEGEFTFEASANAVTPIGTPVNIAFAVESGAYSAQEPLTVVIGLIPEYNMTNTTVTACVGKFYDAGGPDGSYNSNESYVMTFAPATTGAKIRATFNSFATEATYDKLFIYNGADVNAPQVAGSPFSGSTSPGTITSASGSLTFKFTSDGYVTGAGWYADISCYSPTQPPSCATAPEPANNATTVFPTQISWTAQDASEYDVYFGTSQTPSLVATVEVPVYAAILEPNTTYYWKIVPKNAIGPAVGCNDVWTFTTGAAIITMGNGTFTTCSASFFDTGGLDGQYGNNENFTMTFLPASTGVMLQAIFSSFDTENNYDKLYIYDGTSASATQIGMYMGTTSPGTITATNADGALTFKFTSDGSATRAGWQAAIECLITTNLDPTITSTPVTQALVGQVYNYTVSATDPNNNDQLTFDGTTLPSWLSISRSTNGTATLSGTPALANYGENQVLLTVTDGGGLTDTQAFTINVGEVNVAPMFNTAPNVEAVEDQLYSHTFTVDDANIADSVLLVAATTLPSWLQLTFTETSAVLSGTPLFENVGANQVVLSVTDGDITVEQAFAITVSLRPNTAPTMVSTPVTVAHVNENYSFAIEATDIENDTIIISSSSIPTWLTLMIDELGNATLEGIPSASNTGVNEVVLNLSDNRDTTEITYQITVPMVRDITFNVNMSWWIKQNHFVPATDLLDLVGNFNEWGAGLLDTLKDVDNDSIYTVVIATREVGTTLDFKFRINKNDAYEHGDLVNGTNRQHTVVDGENVINVMFNNENSGVSYIGHVKVQISPNPTTGKLNIKTKENSKVVIYNLFGDVVFTKSNLQENNNFDVSNLNAGTYIVKVFTTEGVVTQKINLVK